MLCEVHYPPPRDKTAECVKENVQRFSLVYSYSASWGVLCNFNAQIMCILSYLGAFKLTVLCNESSLNLTPWSAATMSGLIRFRTDKSCT